MSIFRNDPSDHGPFKQIVPQEEPPERQVWKFMVDYQTEKGMPPTLDEISEILPNQWRSSAKHYVEKLIAEGWVETVAEEGKSRRFRAVNAPSHLTGDPTDEIFTSHIMKVNL